MSLPAEWRARVEQWQDALEALTFQPLASVPLEAAFTFQQRTPEQAQTLEYVPLVPGECWGAMWEYAWIRGRIQIPPEAEGKIIVLRAGEPTPQWANAEPYGEWRWLVNGQEVGSRDWAHVDVRLTHHAVEGTAYDLLAEAFGGPTRAGAGGGPALPGVPVIAPVPAKQRKWPDVLIGIWHEEVFQLGMDVQALLELRDTLDQTSLRLDEIDAGLREFTLIANPELTWPDFARTVTAARERLQPLLACHNGTTAPMLFCVGHSHLDVVYQWPFAETERKVARTFSNQLRLLEDYPEYRFLQSMPVLYDVAKRLYPEIYEQVKKAVREGRWIAEGGMWTEADTNMTGGESLIRQFLHGRRFFREEFGVESEFAWLPDVFGYSGALPQIMVGCGMRYFASAKIHGIYNRGEPFPHASCWWEGIDGTRVLSHFPAGYGSSTSPQSLVSIWKDRPQKEGVNSRMVLYGHSDGGGGCERKHLEFLRREMDLEGMPRTRHATPREFFEELTKTASKLPVYVGEIYFPLHRGTLTSQGKIKKENRQCEFALREAECWAAIASILHGIPYPVSQISAAWKNTLFNQFHDILPGSCIRRAVVEAEALYKDALQIARSVKEDSLITLCGENSGSYVAFNSLSWSRTILLPLPADAVVEQDTQTISGVQHTEVTLPPLGWCGISQKPANRTSVTATPRGMEMTGCGWRLMNAAKSPVICTSLRDASFVAAP